MRVGWLALVLLAFVLLSPAGVSHAQADDSLLITEIYYDTPGRDEDEEWFELANLGSLPLSLADYKVGDEEQMGHGEGMARFPDEATVAPGQVLVIARSATGFSHLFGRSPDFELRDSDPAVPDMERSRLWATGDLALANDGDELLLVGPDNVIRDAVSYGDSDYFFSPSVPLARSGHSLARVPATCDSNSAADWRSLPIPTPGTVVLDGACGPDSDPLAGLALLPIGTIQGSGAHSPYLDEVVSFEGMVTGSYEDRNTEGITYYTLFVQALPGGGDGDPATSDGIAVFLGRRRPAVAIGARVLVSGRVTEFYDFTEIDDAGLTLTPIPWDGEPAPLPEAVIVSLPLSAAEFEALEAMRVTLPAARVAGPTHSGCGFAVVAATAPSDRLLRERLEDPPAGVLPVLHTSDVSCESFPNVKVGDQVSGLAGPLIYHFDEFKLVHQEPHSLAVDVAPLPPFPTPVVPAPAEITVASFNLQDYLETEEDLLRIKQEKMAHTISAALGCPSIVGVQEVESEPLLQALVGMLAERCAFTYEITHRDSADVRGIDVALLTNPGQVTVKDAALQQACTALETGIEDPNTACPAGRAPLFSRPPLQVKLSLDENVYTIFVNHFKSKRGGETETAPRRIAQAQHLKQLVAALLTQDQMARIIVMGDFNDYARSATLLAMTEDGQLQNVLLSLPERERYSYVFGGASQLLDGLLLSPAAVAEVTRTGIVHVNADYPSGWALDPAIPFHSSDHDIPFLVLKRPLPEPTLSAPSAEQPTVRSSTLPAPAPPTAVATAAPEPAPEEPSPTPTRSTMPWLAGGGLLLLLVLLTLPRRARRR